MQKPEWVRWGLHGPDEFDRQHMRGYDPLAADFYLTLADDAHDRVAAYLAAHPEAARLYHSGKPLGTPERLGYYDVLARVMTRAEIDRLVAAHARISRPIAEAQRLESERRRREGPLPWQP